MRLLICALLAMASAIAPASPPNATEAERLYSSCPGHELLAKATNVSWQPAESATARHRALRAKLHLDFPESGDRILYYSVGSHHTTVQFSVVAAKLSTGIWHVDEAGEEGPGLLQIAPTPLPHKTYDLSADESRHLDHALEDQCLYASPTFVRNPNVVAGGALQTLDIQTARHQAVLSWFMTRTPQEEQIIRLIARN